VSEDDSAAEDEIHLLGGHPPAPPEGRWVVYVDLDAFYVSCELRERPELRGKPVIVGPPPSEGPSRGVVLSASYEARKFGVRSALPAVVAARLCPDATWIGPDFRKYGEVSVKVRELLARYSEQVVPLSIDEAAVTIDASDPASARAVAEQIQQDLMRSLDLPASLGVATTRIVAKIATDQAKPAGIRLVPPEGVAAFLAPLSVGAIPGVGPKTQEILRRHGATTIGELAARKPSEVAGWLGGFGRELVALARGTPIFSTESEGGPRSRSTDLTFANDIGSWDDLEAAVGRLARELATSLEGEGLRYAGVGVAYRWADFTRSQRSRTLPAAQEGPATLSEVAVRLARELWEAEQTGRRRPVRTVSVRTERLSERTQRQVSLDDFRSGPSSERRT
jgi:DNA polymerase IV